jgi:hypothetical protein
VNGASEIANPNWGGARHGTEGLASIALILLWLGSRRYAHRQSSEGEP